MARSYNLILRLDNAVNNKDVKSAVIGKIIAENAGQLKYGLAYRGARFLVTLVASPAAILPYFLFSLIFPIHSATFHTSSSTTSTTKPSPFQAIELVLDTSPPLTRITIFPFWHRRSSLNPRIPAAAESHAAAPRRQPPLRQTSPGAGP
jgi:hypothetical protein